jgi:hypothetical protein
VGLGMSDLIEHLGDKLGIRVRARGAVRLIPYKDCARIIDACEHERLLIVGIEAFRVVGNEIFPDTDLIADFSELVSEQRPDGCVESVRSARIYFDGIEDGTSLWFHFQLRLC